MRIVHIMPGSGGSFYCQNCLRDNLLVKALHAAGHDVLTVPLYLPPRLDDLATTPTAPVFYGAVSLFLTEKLPVLNRLPRHMLQFLDARWILNWAARRAGSTRAVGLEEMTLSMLRGEEGHQARELDALVAWLRDDVSPQVVHLSNALLLGLARRIRQALNVPIVCSLQDEDVWINAMRPAYARQVWEIMADRARDVDAFVAASRYYAARVAGQLELRPGQLRVIPPGIDVTGRQPAPIPPDPPVIGFLSRMTAALGLDILADAFITLCDRSGIPGLRLHIGGGLSGDDTAFLRHLKRRFRRAGLSERVRFVATGTRGERLAFIQDLTVMCVPVPEGEAFGLHIIEALAAGVPVVQPAVGAYPELLEATGGGVLYDPHTPGALVTALNALLKNPERGRELGTRGRAAVHDRFSVDAAVRKMIALYSECVAGSATTLASRTQAPEHAETRQTP